MLLTETAPPALNPVPLREFAAHLKLGTGFDDDPAEDALLELYLRNATAVVETRLSRALIRRGHTLRLGHWNRKGHAHLPIGPVDAIGAVRFVGSGDPVTLDLAGLALAPGSSGQAVTGLGGASLPVIPPGHVAEIDFEAGYGESWNEVPDDLRQSVILLAASYYENRFAEYGSSGPGIPAGVAALLTPHMPVRI